MASRNLKNFEFRLGRPGIMFFAVGMSLLLFFVFIIGVMVGLHIDAYPEKIAGLPEIIRKRLYSPAVNTERISPGGEKTPLPDDAGDAGSLPDSLSLEEEESTASPGLEEKKSSPVAFPSGNMDGKEKSVDVGGDAGARPAATLPVVKKQESKLPPSDVAGEDGAQPPNVGGKYLVQAGSFQNINKADELSNKIIPLGYKPRVATTEVAGKGKWSRVVIEGFETKEEAMNAARVLSEKIKGVTCIVRPIK
ncbi:MAG TPA: SPOR domain-containing protein [Syntrophales bacterium]|nr:SPOR domain-containing protein [Syntrophales bacterium]